MHKYTFNKKGIDAYFYNSGYPSCEYHFHTNKTVLYVLRNHFSGLDIHRLTPLTPFASAARHARAIAYEKLK